MRKEDFFEVLGELDDDIVKEAQSPIPIKRKTNWKVWGGMAACIYLAAVGILAVQKPGEDPDMGVDGLLLGGNTGIDIILADNNSEIDPPARDDYLVVNELDSLSSADMDVEYSFYKKLPYHVWMGILEDFCEFTGVGYEDFIAKVPDTWEHVNFYSLAVRGYKDAELGDEYRLHDYVFDFQTAEGGKARIALCPLEKPLRDYYIYCDNPNQSEINGIPIVIYGYNDLFLAGFCYGNLNYDIETRGIELEELEELLSGILTDSETDIDIGLDDYEYYLTEEELMADIEQGYIFRIDTVFQKPKAPNVSQGNWPFYVHEENTVSLEVEFSDLLMKPKESIFPMDEQIIVEVVSPDGQSVYRFEKTGEGITEDTSIQEQISVTPGEWVLRISFAYVCGETSAHLKIAAAYETPSEDDINWLKEERLNR